MAARDTPLDSGLIEEPGECVSDDTEPTKNGRTAERVVLVMYLLVLAWVVLLKIHTDGFSDLVGRRSINLIPFGGTASGGLGSSELAVNVLAFIPLGMLVHLATRRRRFTTVFLPVVGVSLTFEIIQYAFGIGASDITDVITNSTGGLIGAGIAWVGLRVFGDRAQRWLLATLVILLVALGVALFTWLQVTGVRFRL